MGNDDVSRLWSDVVEKMIDSQISNTEAATSLRDSINEMNAMLSEIRTHFSNGFRAEIKEHITECNEENEKLLKNLVAQNKEIQEEIKSFKKFGFWVRVGGGFIAAIAMIAVAVNAIVQRMGP